MTSVSVSPSQALARKRRKEILASQKTAKRPRIDQSEDDDEEERRDDCGRNRAVVPAECTLIKSPPPKTSSFSKATVIKSSTKYQNRYEPEVPMSKEEEAEWRKEARRQRNRESAANSRNKVRNLIEELENEVEDWKAKYASLMDRIAVLEKGMGLNGSHRQQSSYVPSSPLTPTPKTIYVPSCISTCSGIGEHCDLSIPLFPNSPKSFDDSSSSTELPHTHQHGQQINVQNVTINLDPHVIEMTSRPAASS